MFGFIANPCARCTGESLPVWRGTFCGLARCLGREFGNPARLLANRDAAFVGLLGVSLDPAAPQWKPATCCNPAARPFPVLDDHPAVLHAAAVTVCGLAAKLADDAQDEGVFRRAAARAGSWMTAPATDRAVAILNSGAFPTAQVMEALAGQEMLESGDPLRADQATAAAYGAITAHLADLMDCPTQRETLHRTGAALGSLVYWRDAWLDRRDDQRRGRFNPFSRRDEESIRARVNGSWSAFCAALDEVTWQRHGNLISQLQNTTAARQQAFLSLADPGSAGPDKSRQKKRKSPKKTDCWCDYCDCAPCDCCAHSRPAKSGCCDAACDCGPGDTGCCDCNPCDGCACH